MEQEFAVDSFLDEIVSLEKGPLLVEAGTGSGKSTRIPLALLENEIPFIMVEPRRVVAKSIYSYLSKITNSGRLGYQVRFERQIPKNATGLIVTPGILLNYLQDELPIEPSWFLFDEFHERQKEVDFLYALLRNRCREKLMFLSATLDHQELKEHLGELTHLQANQKRFEVDIIHDKTNNYPSMKDIGERIKKVLLESSFQVALVFLPGSSQIREVRSHLQDSRLPPVFEVFGSQNLESQEKAIRNSQRRIVLSTNLLESSLTIEDVDLVIDSGLKKALRYHYNKEVLCMEMISSASATQRAGRTGRTCPGRVVRLWGNPNCLKDKDDPEILRCDLTDLLARSEEIKPVVNVGELPFLTPPHSYQWEDARTNLQRLLSCSSRDKLRDSTLSVEESAQFHEIKEEFPETCAYLLFFFAMAQTRKLSYPKVKEGEKRAQDFLLFQSYSKDKSSFDRAFVDCYEGLLRSYQLKHPFELSSNDRDALVQYLILKFPFKALFHVRKNIYRNDQSQEYLGPDERKGRIGLFLLDFFVGQDTRKPNRFVSRVSVYFDLMKQSQNRLLQLPATRFERKTFVVRQDEAKWQGFWYFGPHQLHEGEEIVQGREMLVSMIDAGHLEKRFPELEKFLFYFNLFKQEEGVELHEEFLIEQMLELGVESPADLELVEMSDLFPGTFIFEISRLQDKYPKELSQPGGTYQMSYKLKSKEVYFQQNKGTKEPSNLLTRRFHGWKCFWSIPGRCVEV